VPNRANEPKDAQHGLTLRIESMGREGESDKPICANEPKDVGTGQILRVASRRSVSPAVLLNCANEPKNVLNGGTLQITSTKPIRTSTPHNRANEPKDTQNESTLRIVSRKLVNLCGRGCGASEAKDMQDESTLWITPRKWIDMIDPDHGSNAPRNGRKNGWVCRGGSHLHARPPAVAMRRRPIARRTWSCHRDPDSQSALMADWSRVATRSDGAYPGDVPSWPCPPSANRSARPKEMHR
jgi:hypothetical protein